MRNRDLLQTAWKGVRTNLRRSLLTMLGIIIGVGSVVVMSAVGESMKGVILGQISSLGAKSMVIFPGNEQEGGASQVMTGHDSLTFADLAALQNLQTLESFAPVIFVTGEVSFGTETSSAQVFGTNPNFFRNQNIEVRAGRLFDESDDDRAAAVAVLGPDAANDLFGEQNPLGKRIQIEDRHFAVIGILEPLGSQFFQNADDRIYVPYTLARSVTGQKFINYITMLSTKNFDVAFADAKGLLRQRHGIVNPKDDPEKDDFMIRSSEQAGDILGAVSLGLTLFITTIAGISLFVGGIGIMNVMYVTVTERTREIGLRKAIGAKRKDILLQFLAEAIVLTVVGGLLGMVLGIGLAWFVSLIVELFLATYSFSISLPAIVIALIMAALTGIVFGLSPARKAASLHPIEALRYE